MPEYLVILSTIGAIVMMITMTFVRSKVAERPVNAKKIILPPVFMSTGGLMFVFPVFRVSMLELAEAVVVGLLFSIFLIVTSNFEIKGEDIYLKKSKAFAIVFVILLVLRIVLKLVLSQSIDYGALSGMFWIIAFSMLWPWRIAMLVKFNRLKRNKDFVI